VAKKIKKKKKKKKRQVYKTLIILDYREKSKIILYLL